MVVWGCEAFTTAQQNMYEISLYVDRIPTRVQDIYSNFNNFEYISEVCIAQIGIDCLLKFTQILSELETTTENCKKLAYEVVEKFTNVKRLVQDVGEYLIESNASSSAEIVSVLKRGIKVEY